MTPAGKYSLTLEQKKSYSIPTLSESYIFIWDNVSEDQCPEMISFLKKNEFTVVDQKLEEGKFKTKDFLVTVYKE